MITGLVAAVLLQIAPAATPPTSPLTPAEILTCLGTSRYAASPERLAKLRAEAERENWALACRQARDANARRLSATRALFATGASPVGGYTSATKHLAHAREAKDPLHVELFRRAARDQAARESLGHRARETYARGLPPLAIELLNALVSADAVEIDADNRQWLRGVIKERGWFTISRDGEAADYAAWVIVQHADMDREFQQETLTLLDRLIETGETSKGNFAYLHDRVAAGLEKPQRFGTQGRCAGPGDWRPRPLEDAAAIDSLRVRVGLEPHADYLRQMNAICR